MVWVFFAYTVYCVPLLPAVIQEKLMPFPQILDSLVASPTPFLLACVILIFRCYAGYLNTLLTKFRHSFPYHKFFFALVCLELSMFSPPAAIQHISTPSSQSSDTLSATTVSSPPSPSPTRQRRLETWQRPEKNHQYVHLKIA